MSGDAAVHALRLLGGRVVGCLRHLRAADRGVSLPAEGTRGSFADQEQLALFEEVLGPIPAAMARRGRRAAEFVRGDVEIGGILDVGEVEVLEGVYAA